MAGKLVFEHLNLSLECEDTEDRVHSILAQLLVLPLYGVLVFYHLCEVRRIFCNLCLGLLNGLVQINLGLLQFVSYFLSTQGSCIYLLHDSCVNVILVRNSLDAQGCSLQF